MSGIICAWAANMSQSSTQWYEDEYIPSTTSKLAQHALHCELVGTGLGAEVDGIGTQEAPWKWLTLYEVDDANKATAATYDESNRPAMAGGLEHARLDVRTYEELKRWQADDWEGEYADIASVAVMEWQVEEGREKEVLDFYKAEAAPTIASSPEVLRFRMFKIQNATVFKAGLYETLGKETTHTYLTVAELEREEWPWDVVVVLGENPKWREYFDSQKAVKWQSSHYLVKRSYPDPDEDGKDI
ncbi:uncharacterized protein EKO05_0000708 [Ascochyta rabiei]|uniref:Uncharacterized protein n=1 Tax=Didymella rabiei TaxID=5454 RepID=A0A163B3Z0_DIDRA|nr:uncharacterized protein EKO05_0000708 [Ascochyta rabiei]KZM21557.1 hypothetical protein ST47_g7281 [Ascochyta rabiei]UPX10032.1 hypothetical protein EKO05_0000708 [Ascochyta rabiei]